MIQFPNLVPECNVDTAFVEMLGYTRPNHAANIQQVCLILENQKGSMPCIGFVDDDKKKPPYILSNFIFVEKSRHFSIMKHNAKNQFLVVAKPAMDKVIHELCKDLEIDISKYGFPKEFAAFLTKTKKGTIKRDMGFKNLLNAIKQKAPEEIIFIKSFLSKYY